MKYIFIINPKSGGKDTSSRLVNHIKETFSDLKGHYFKIVFTEYAGHAREIAAECSKTGVDIVVAGGGDGTMNEVCSALVNSPNTSFGLIPIGSGNGFARSLRIPLNSKMAILKLVDPDKCSIDVGIINDQYFFGTAGLGFDAEIGAKFQEFGTRGPLPYFYIALREFFKYKYEEFTITMDNDKIRVSPLLLTIANTNQYGNGAVIAPMADYSDGLLDVCIIEKLKFSEGIRKLNTLFNNKIETLSTYSSYKTTKLKIERSQESGIYHIDGEPKQGGKQLDIELLKRALKVCK